jgi:hypothetical protein
MEGVPSDEVIKVSGILLPRREAGFRDDGIWNPELPNRLLGT